VIAELRKPQTSLSAEQTSPKCAADLSWIALCGEFVLQPCSALLPTVAEGTVASSWRYRDLLEVPCLAEGTVGLL
jgi:hypothetical protein